MNFLYDRLASPKPFYSTNNTLPVFLVAIAILYRALIDVIVTLYSNPIFTHNTDSIPFF